MFTNKLFIAFALVLALAGRALAVFNVTYGEKDLTISELIPTVIGDDCPDLCNTAKGNMQGCNDDANCLCRRDTLDAFTACEQCLFNEVIRTNKPVDPFIGSSPLLGAYGTACNVTTGTKPPADALTLTLPDFWDGPFVSVLPVGLAVLYTIFGGIFGVSALLILCNM
ncbi:hypothetical protein ONZ45_g11398 [Pleurotus djamor]|nr:hypothetical protein ONZ45_g11398 [Pleurotus djamor]